MKKILYILFLVSTAFSYSQVGIGNDNPQGALDLNLATDTSKMGLVLPRVQAVDTLYLPTTPDGAQKYFPSVTVPNDPFQVITINSTDEDGNSETNKFQMPVKEAPQGTLVYDANQDCVRYKKSSILGDWSGCIVDSISLSTDINYKLYGGADFKMLKASAGYRFSIAIGADDQSVYAAGYGSYYGTGKGRTGNTTWSLILGQKAVDVSAGYQHGLAVLEDGSLWTWGSNSYGRTCQNTSSGYTTTPKKVTMPAGAKVVRAEAGYYTTMILTDDGKVYTCGRSSYGLNGNGTSSSSPYILTPTQMTTLPAGTVVKDIALAPRGSAILTQDGKLYTLGDNAYYRTGRGTNSGYTTTPTVINPTGVSFKKVAMGIGSGIAASTDDKIYGWGYLYGTLNNPTYQTPTAFATSGIEAGETIIGLAAARVRNGSFYGTSSMVITNKNVYVTGMNTSYGTNPGKLGIVNIATGAAPSNVSTISPSVAFVPIQTSGIFSGTVFTGGSIGYVHTIITTDVYPDGNNRIKDNLGFGAGNNSYLQLGTGNTSGWRIMSSIKK